MSSLSARTALYFKHHVGAVLKLTPAPSTSKEADFIYQSFKGLGSLEFFSIRKGRLNAYEPYIRLIYNPSKQPLQLDPFNDVDPAVVESHEHLALSLTSIAATLSSICALPRFSYIEGDEKYFLKRLQVDFSHSLKRESLRFDKKYSISPSTVDKPFALMSVEDTSVLPSEIVRNIRHNFQKHHKIEAVHIYTGPEALKQVGRSEMPALGHSKEVSLPDLMDLKSPLKGVHQDAKLNPTDYKRVSAGFTGFYH